jgi:type IV secretory pathway TraG/TraD family ATPase VirD4
MDNVRTFLTLKTITDTIIRVRHEETGKPAGEAFHWIEQEENLIYGMLFAALLKKDEERNLLSVSEALAGGSETVMNYITSAISTTGVEEKSAKQLYLELNSFLNAKDQKQAEEAVKGAKKKMEIFRSPFVRRHMIRPELDINMLFKEPCLLVIKAPMNLPESILFASMLTRLVMLKIYETARERKSRNHNIWLYLDEFPSLMLPDITKFVATVRSSGGGVIAAVQAKEDLTTSTKATLKGNSPESLETNFGTTVILPGCHLQTCERIARSFGETMVMDKSKIQDVFAFFNYRSMKRWTRAPLVTADSLQYMPEGIAMISPNSRRPFFVKVQPYYKIRKYSKKTQPVKAWKPDMSGPFEKITREDKLDNKLEQEMKNLIDPPEDPPMAEIRNTPVYPPQIPGSGYEQARKEHDEFGKNIADDYLANTDKSHHGGRQFI